MLRNRREFANEELNETRESSRGCLRGFCSLRMFILSSVESQTKSGEVEREIDEGFLFSSFFFLLNYSYSRIETNYSYSTTVVEMEILWKFYLDR